MSSTRSLVASAVAVFSNRPRVRDRRFVPRTRGRSAVKLRLGKRLADLTLDHVEDPVGPRRESQDCLPELELHLLDVPRGLELLLGTQHVQLRHVAEVHRQEAGRLFVAANLLLGGDLGGRLLFLVSSSSSSSESAASSAAASTARTSPATSSVSSVSISTPGVAPSAPSTSSSSTAGSPAGSPIASADSGSVSLAGTGRVAGTLALASTRRDGAPMSTPAYGPPRPDDPCGPVSL